MKDRLEKLLRSVEGVDRLLILPHNDPDPDAIASAVALHHLLAAAAGVETEIAYRGIIGRAENKALVRYLDHPLRRLSAQDLGQPPPLALVDTQPGAGNNPWTPPLPVTIVLDHHPWREESGAATFADVRSSLGATSTILTEYLQAAGIDPPPALATALFYGVKTDTMGLGRGATPDDVSAYFYLQRRVDVDALVEIERAQVPAEYFKQLSATLHAAQVYDDVVVSYVGPMRRPDMAAEMADFLLRLEGIRWVLCLGTYGGDLILAVRSRSQRVGAGQLAQEIVGGRGSAGGHGTMAGGQIPLDGTVPDLMAQQISRRALAYLRVSKDTKVKTLI